MKPGSLARVSAIILAAGNSTRMGEAKQLLPLGDSTILAKTIANARDAEVHEIVLVLGSSAETIRRELPASLLEGLKVVINEEYAKGIANSLRAALSALHPRSDGALVILGDQPLIRAQTLNQIIKAYRHSAAPIVIPSYQGSPGNPVLLHRSVFSEVIAMEGDTGFLAIFQNHLDGIVKVEVEDAGVLVDIDDHEDYDRLRRAGASSAQPKPTHRTG